MSTKQVNRITKMYLPESVLEAGKNRMRRLFDEFDRVVISHSGGKDSTVLCNLALMIAEEQGRLPLDVVFIDQEAEWQATIDYMRDVVFADPRVRAHWLQCPIRISNGTAELDPWLYCWREGEQWMREKEPNSIHENIYGTLNFKKMFTAYCKVTWMGEAVAQCGGVRCEESPARFRGLTNFPTYKDITWGNKDGAAWGHFTFYPLYDWTFTDIFKAIEEHSWPYNPLYDWYYQYGLPRHKMRVSSLHHEMAIRSLTLLHELEPQTWEAAQARLPNANTVSHGYEMFGVPEKLPFMFRDWTEYRDHLVDNLIQDPDKQALYRKQFATQSRDYVDEVQDDLAWMQTQAVLSNDYHGVFFSSWQASNITYSKRYQERMQSERQKAEGRIHAASQHQV